MKMRERNKSEGRPVGRAGTSGKDELCLGFYFELCRAVPALFPAVFRQAAWRLRPALLTHLDFRFHAGAAEEAFKFCKNVSAGWRLWHGVCCFELAPEPVRDSGGGGEKQ